MSQQQPTPTEEAQPSTEIVSRVRELLGLRSTASARAGTAPGLDDLLRTTREALVDCASFLGLRDLSRLTKDALARRVQQALQAVIRVLPEPRSGADAPIEPGASHKFDLGLPPAGESETGHIPWGYGADRVTAMVVDPERLYVYWEVTDGAIDRARAGLGSGGADAWLNLRIYDVTGRIFDGTNAHGYFDQRIERTDRQWFFHIDKPSSTACLEIGMKSLEGYFVRIARSGRAEFPRREPVGPGEVEWLTVHAASASVEHAGFGAPARPGAWGGGGAGAGAPGAGDGGVAEGGGTWPSSWWIESVADVPVGEWSSYERVLSEHLLEGHWDWREYWRTHWGEQGGRLEWVGPLVQTSWEAGPFAYAVESPVFVEERHAGGRWVYARNGHTHVVYGPWQVVIRGLGAHAERRVIAVWEMRRGWVAEAGTEIERGGPRMVLAGGSDIRLGASERRWMIGSEVRLGGASEIFRLGASEIRLRGASETVYVGASERWARGASEVRFLGASEWRARGASEVRLLGASERRLVGASEWRLGGASEQRFMGASERARGGASERRFVGGSESPYPAHAGSDAPPPTGETPRNPTR